MTPNRNLANAILEKRSRGRPAIFQDSARCKGIGPELERDVNGTRGAGGLENECRLCCLDGLKEPYVYGMPGYTHSKF